MADFEKRPVGKRERQPSKVERLMESPQYKKERLRDLTGIEDEQKLFEIYYELKQLFLRVGLENLNYRSNTVDDRNGTETQFEIHNLNGEDLVDFEDVLKQLRVFGFPEPIEGKNYSNLIIENRRDLEVLRLMSVFKDIDKAREQQETARRIQKEADLYMKKMQAEYEERVLQLEQKEREDALIRMYEEMAKAKQYKIAELHKRWDDEKAEFAKKRNEEQARMDAIIDEALAKIRPQEIDMDVELADLQDPFVDVTRFGGFQPRLPRERTRVPRPVSNTHEAREVLDEVDPIELDERMARYKALWQAGTFEDIEGEPKRLPGSHVDLSLFPKTIVWRLDKKSMKKKCYEYDPVTKQLGKEITRQERDTYILRLKDLRSDRFAREAESGTELPKSKEEVAMEQKVLLLLNNLIVWLINDLTSQMRGNAVLRQTKENDADDLYQNAVIGLLYSLDNHDPAKMKSGTIVSYVMACMEGYIRRTHWQEQGLVIQKNQVRIPEYTLSLRRQILRAERLLRSRFPDETDARVMEARLAEALAQPGVDILRGEGSVPELRKLRERFLMDYEEVAYEILDSENLDVDTKVNQLAELLHSEPEQELYMERVHLKEEMSRMLMTLSPREERVIRMRFFPEAASSEKLYLSGDRDTVEGLSLEEVGKNLGVTRERIRQMEAKAIRKLRHPSRNKDIKAYKSPERDYRRPW